MKPQVNLQRPLCRKFFLTFVALVKSCFFFVVSCEVIGQIGFSVMPCFTHFALVRFFAEMASNVRNDRILDVKFFLAYVAFIRIFMNFMFFDMPIQIYFIREFFGALVALKSLRIIRNFNLNRFVSFNMGL